MTETPAAFWDTVRAREGELFGMPLRERVEALNAWLAPHAQGLAAEAEGKDEDERFRLVLTAHGAVERFEALLALASCAPAMPRIDVVAFRQRVPKGFDMRMEGFELATREVLLRQSAARGRIALEIGFARPIPMDLRDHARNMAFIMLDHLLGEYDFAIKVGAVDFVDDDPAAAAGFDGIPLDEFVPRFDAFWREALGHTGDFPTGEARWSSLRGHATVDGEQRPLLVQRNDSANALVGRADLGHCLLVAMHVDSNETLARAQALEDALCAALERHEEGCLSHVVLEGGERSLCFYLAEPAALGRAQAVLERLGWPADQAAQVRMARDFDPAWERYGQWLG